MIRSELREDPSVQLPVASVHSVLSFNSPLPGQVPQAPAHTAGLPSTDAASGRRERRRKEVFERLLNAARDVIVTRGLENATVKDITDAADVGKGTFFLHFRSKEHVVPALLERDGSMYQRALERARGGESVIKLFEALLSVNQTALSLDNTIFFRSHVLAVIAKDDVRELSMRSLTANSERLEALMTLGQERGEIRRDYTAADMVRLTQQVILGAKLLAMWGKSDPSADCLTSSRQLLLALMQAPPISLSKPARQALIPAARGKAPAAARRRGSRRL
jgi:AcrR family transcriptional regulator